LRSTTERPVTLTHGTNVLVDADPEAIIRSFSQAIQGGRRLKVPPPFWDGNAARRIVEILAQDMEHVQDPILPGPGQLAAAPI